MELPNESSQLVPTKPPSPTRKWNLLKVVTVVVLVFVVAAFLVTTLVMVSRKQGEKGNKYSPIQKYSLAAIVSDAKPCSAIGKEMLQKGGSSVDSAIATSLCIGIHSMQSSGIGGGSFMMIYERPKNGETKELRALDFREVAPSAANIDIYNGTGSMYSSGGFSVGVPGEIAGYWEAWQRYGRLSWSELFQPTIKMCREGFSVPEFLAEQMKDASDYHIPETCGSGSNLRELLYKPDGSVYSVGDTLKLPKLADTLERIANSNGAELYTGRLSVDVLKDLKDISSLATASDLSSVRPVWREPVNFTVGDVQLSTLPLPASGPLLNLILNILQGYPVTADKVLAYHHIIEADKFAYALKTRMGDPGFANLTKVVQEACSEDFAAQIRAKLDDDHTHNISYYDPVSTVVENHGTSHIGVLTPEGSAVAITSTINSEFGSKCIGSRTGIIFNNEMDDFLIPHDAGSYQSVNLIAGGKRAQSSMVPTILFDKDSNVVGLTGGSGGSQITTSVAFILWHHLIAGEGIAEAVTTPRVLNKLTPNVVKYEPDIPQDVLRGLQQKGHKIEEDSSIAVCNSIQSRCHQAGHEKDCITAVSDRRKLGEPDGW